ncbi:MAG: polysaccharide biosynthesis/export family protein [Thiotrichales bacterium]
MSAWKLLFLLVILLQTSVANALTAEPDTLSYDNQSSAPLHEVDDTRQEKTQASIADAASRSVFGEQLFGGNFSRDSFTGFNPAYVIGVGDKITLRMWGAFNFDQTLVVDAKGNIFVPSVGPVKVQGVRNDDLTRVVHGKIKRVYKSNVQSYVNLAEAQPVKVYVSGFARNPGLYAGISSDSVLSFLDKAGGVDPESGSYVSIRLLRDGEIIRQFNLYEFLMAGTIAQVQLHDGDTIHVMPRQNVVDVSGLVVNPYSYEFSGQRFALDKLMKMADMKPEATNIRVVRNSGTLRHVDYYSVDEIASVHVDPGDSVVVIADKRPGTISVRVEGEHAGKNEYILPYGTTLGSLLHKVNYSSMSNKQAIQLFRKSVQVRQKELLEQSLYSLQASVLTAKSATVEESQLRDREAERVLKWIEEAREIEPRGQVILGSFDSYQDITLEDGDTIRVPAKNKLVLVHGEVLFPNAVVFDRGRKLSHYINQAGGLTQSANKSRVILLHPDGSFDHIKYHRISTKHKVRVKPGDEILVLPKVTLKKLQLTKDISQVLYQVAIAAAVVIRL